MPIKVTDFERPSSHPWGMLEGYKSAMEKEETLVWMLGKCMDKGAFVPVKTKVGHEDLVADGLLEKVGRCLYILTKKAIGLLYGYYSR